MGRLAVVMAVVAAAAAVLAVARDDPALRMTASAPIEPCAAAAPPGRMEMFRRTSIELGPVIVLRARERLPRAAALRALVAPGVAVRVRIDGATFAGGARERRLAVCAPLRIAQRADRVLGHRLVSLGLHATRPACARVTVEVEGGGITQSRRLGLGRDCPGAVSGGAFAGCETRVEPAMDPQSPWALRVGPLTLNGTHGPVTGRPLSLKTGLTLRAGAMATLRIAPPATISIPSPARRSVRVVTFVACPRGEPLFSRRRGTVGAHTGFVADIVAPAPACVPIEVRVPGRPALRARLPVGVAMRAGVCG